MKASRRLWILVFLVVLIGQFNLYTLYVSVSDFTGAATGTADASLTILSDDTVVYPVCNSTLTTNNGRWNYVSIPLVLADGDIKTELSSIAGKYDLVYEYDHSAGNFKYYYEPFDYGNIGTLTDGTCYLIKATEDGVITNFNGTAHLTSINHSLVTTNGRWNYVGWVAEETDLDVAFASIDGMFDLSYVYRPFLGIFRYYYSIFRVGDYSTVEPCGCQLIKATEEGELFYSMD